MHIFSYTKSCWIAMSCTVIALVACGGSDSTTPIATDASDKYVGTWKRCIPYNIPQGSFLAYSETAAITKVTASSYRSVSSRADHTDVNCSTAGTPIVGESLDSVFSLVGTKSIGGNIVDTVTYPTGPSTTAKDIAYVNSAGPTLQIGDTNSGLDANGFYNALDNRRFLKQ
jgi:hypothetical protein